MSIRFHARTPLLSLWHDPHSPESVRLLQELHKRLSASSASKAGQSVADASRSEAQGYLELVARSAPGSEEPFAELQIIDRHSNPPTETQWQSIRSYLPAHVATPSAFAQDAIDYAAMQGAATASVEHAHGNDGRQTHPAVVGSAAAPPDGSVRTRIREARGYKPQSAVPLASESTSPALASEKEPYAATPLEPNATEYAELQKATDLSGVDEDTSALPVRLRPGPILVAWDDGVAAADWAGAKEILNMLEKRNQSKGVGRGSSCVIA
ncbi:hypothetical protein CBOM_01174 [Ceraceosorus bombacis]|uniref:Uncharacterized protein n=1 Tax=Ceraceosorus bombacis TaxID=401625 RepID=A0A0P1BAZ5_9BASI|nr:hypothetical protein CBOM_01174 [Ceraceosorus bombacis]